MTLRDRLVQPDGCSVNTIEVAEGGPYGKEAPIELAMSASQPERTLEKFSSGHREMPLAKRSKRSCQQHLLVWAAKNATDPGQAFDFCSGWRYDAEKKQTLSGDYGQRHRDTLLTDPEVLPVFPVPAGGDGELSNGKWTR